MSSTQGVQDLGSGFKGRLTSLSPKRSKRTQPLRRNNRTLDSFDEGSDDDLNIIGGDDSASHITLSKDLKATVFGKKVNVPPEYQNTSLPKGLNFKKKSSASTNKPSPLQENSNAGPSTSSKSLQASVTRSADKVNANAKAPPATKPERPKPKPVKRRVEGTPIPPPSRPSSQEAQSSPKPSSKKAISRELSLGEDKPTAKKAKHTILPPMRKTYKANVSTGASPLKSRKPRERTIAPFPMSQAPQQKPSAKIKRKKIISTDESSGEDQDKIAAFPMSPDTLQSLRSSSPITREVSESPGRNQGPSRKKKRSDSLPRAFSISDDDNDDLGKLLPIRPSDAISVFSASGAGPVQLCPYCDAVLPSNPSSHLLSLLAKIEAKSYPEPRPNNPNARSAPFATYIIVCQRHEFEKDLLPKAKARGWPLSIDWKALADRVQAMSSYLEDLITQPDGPERKRSSYWREITSDIRTKGTRAVKGVHGQYEYFERIQPGYYGEMGSVIIHQTLFSMFPLMSFNSRAVEPLTPEEFTRSVLVPEVVVRLVAEDQSLGEGPAARDKAMKIMRESAAYGTAMFPEDSGERAKKKPAGKSGSKKKKQDAFVEDEDEEELGVGDLILLERARQRRKELKEEEEMEEADTVAEESAPEKRPLRHRKLKPSSSAMSIDSRSDLLCDSSDIEPLDYGLDVKAARKNLKRVPGKKPKPQLKVVEIELSSDGEIMTSNEDGPPPASSMVIGSPTQTMADSESDIEEETPRPPKPKPVAKSRSKKAHAGWSHSLADPVDSSTDRSSPPPVNVPKEDHSWLLNDM